MASSCGGNGVSKRKRKRDKKKKAANSQDNSLIADVPLGVECSHGRLEEQSRAVNERENCHEIVSSLLQDSVAVSENENAQTDPQSRITGEPLNQYSKSSAPCHSSSTLNTKPVPCVSNSEGNAKDIFTQNYNTSTKQPNFAVTNPSTFEQELNWCIGQLELGLLRPNATKRQKEDNERHVKILRSSKTHLPRKRQIMKNLFGDYRTKMKTQPLPDKFPSIKKPEISSVEKETMETTGIFYKLSAVQAHKSTRTELTSTNLKSLPTTTGFGLEENEFRFNFQVDSYES